LPDGLFSNQPPSFFTLRKAFEWEILVSFMTIWYTLGNLLYIFYGSFVYVVAIPILVYFIKKNLATLLGNLAKGSPFFRVSFGWKNFRMNRPCLCC
jgi:hypothetical protein